MTTTRPPSGEQWQISHGDHQAVVVAVGGGVREYTVAGRPVLDGYDVAAQCDGARGQTLVPWPNRVQDGVWTWRGVTRQLAITEPEQHNAIHGLLRWVGWQLVSRTESAVTVGATSYPQPGYPWRIRVENSWSLDADGLCARTTIVNESPDPAPVALGFHPYVTTGTATIDEATLHIPAETWLPTGGQQIPTGREPVAGTTKDFRQPRRLGDATIDHTFTDLSRDDDGRFRLALTSPSGGGVIFWVDESFPCVEVFTGDALPDESRRRQGLGVEPMTAPPNAMATGQLLVVLAPDQTWTGAWGVSPSTGQPS